MTNREEEATNPATLVVNWPARLQPRK